MDKPIYIIETNIADDTKIYDGYFSTQAAAWHMMLLLVKKHLDVIQKSFKGVKLEGSEKQGIVKTYIKDYTTQSSKFYLKTFKIRELDLIR